MNYDKKRKRQNGRQVGGTLSERDKIYYQSHYCPSSELIQRMIEAGVLPEIKFAFKNVTEEEFKSYYPSENI